MCRKLPCLDAMPDGLLHRLDYARTWQDSIKWAESLWNLEQPYDPGNFLSYDPKQSEMQRYDHIQGKQKWDIQRF